MSAVFNGNKALSRFFAPAFLALPLSTVVGHVRQAKCLDFRQVPLSLLVSPVTSYSAGGIFSFPQHYSRDLKGHGLLTRYRKVAYPVSGLI